MGSCFSIGSVIMKKIPSISFLDFSISDRDERGNSRYHSISCVISHRPSTGLCTHALIFFCNGKSRPRLLSEHISYMLLFSRMLQGQFPQSGGLSRTVRQFSEPLLCLLFLFLAGFNITWLILTYPKDLSRTKQGKSHEKRMNGHDLELDSLFFL